MNFDAIKKNSDIKMHSWFLYLRPSSHEQQYFAQLEALDLLNCLIAPIFFATTLDRWPRSFLAGVYCLVLAIKGYQIALLVLPTARAVDAHQKARYWLIFSERALRQFVATPALGRGPRFVQWLRDTAAADPGPLTALKQMLLICGATHAFWNTFCLPLDMPSQVLFNVIFFLLHFPPIVSQVAFSVGMLVKHRPQLVWLQWGPAKCRQQHSTAAATGLDDSCSSSTVKRLSNVIPADILAAGSQTVREQQQLLWTDAAAAVVLPPARAPDLVTPAGRLVLALSTAFMLFVVLYLPLFFAFWIERHLKSRFMAAVARRAQIISSKVGLKAQSAVLDTRGSGSGSGSGSATGAAKPGEAGWSSAESPEYGIDGESANSCCERWVFIQPPVVLPVLPSGRWTLATHMVAAAAGSFMLGEMFVALCSACPLVANTLWRQIPGA